MGTKQAQASVALSTRTAVVLAWTSHRGVPGRAVAAVAGQEQMPGGATYGASGDFNKFSPNQIRWIDATELQKRLTESTGVVVVDVREPQDFAAGTIPGARNLSQGSLFMDHKPMLPLLNEIAAMASHSELVLFANTGGVDGPAAGRDLYVLNFLAEVATPQVPIDRMLRLKGGLTSWKQAGFELAVPTKPAAVRSLDQLLSEVGLEHLEDALKGQSLESLVAVFSSGRTQLLDELKALGLKLPDRQKLANAVSRTVKLSQGQS